MTTQAEIDEQIKGDYERFWNSPYNGDMPDMFMFKFRTVLMFHNSKSLPATPHKIKELIGLSEGDLKFVDVGIILNTIFTIPFNSVYDSPEEAIDDVLRFVDIQNEFNKRVSEVGAQIERKRLKKYEICGIANSAPMNGTLKPIK